MRLGRGPPGAAAGAERRLPAGAATAHLLCRGHAARQQGVGHRAARERGHVAGDAPWSGREAPARSAPLRRAGRAHGFRFAARTSTRAWRCPPRSGGRRQGNAPGRERLTGRPPLAREREGTQGTVNTCAAIDHAAEARGGGSKDASWAQSVTVASTFPELGANEYFFIFGE